MVDSIFETSSVELCSIESKLYIKSEKLKKLEKKRQDAVEKRKQAREKKRNNNLKQIDEINENVPLEYILQFIAISDILRPTHSDTRIPVPSINVRIARSRVPFFS